MASSPYAPAAQLLSHIWTKHKSLKSLAYDSNGKLRCNKATYAQVCHVLESKSFLDTIVKKVNMGTVRNEALLYVLLYELLLGPNKSIRGGGALKRQLLKKQEALREALQDAKKQCTSSAVSFPRYVRVNTLCASVDEVVRELKSSGITEIYADVHVPNLLVLPPSTKLPNDHVLLQSGKVVLQDKSSCFSAMCLVDDHIVKGDCLDACAAPGNKTSHLAALVAAGNKQKGRTPTIFALDRSSTRFQSLSKRMQQLVSGTKVKVVPQHQDFLQTKPANYKGVKCILLDPSCSGSGIFTSPDRINEEDSTERLCSLSNFQFTCLKHAMSFPSVERIVYSTCSLHEQENELVVVQALSGQEEEWQIVAPQCLRNWNQRGKVVEGLMPEQAQCMVRADQGDETNGFFVTCLERICNKSDTADTTTATTTPNKPIFDPPKGLAFYNGEFKSEGNGTEDAARNETKDENQRPRKKAKHTNAAPSKSSSENKTSEAKSDKPMSKKRAKKIAWKKRQMEQKLQRMQQKQQKQEPKQDHGNDTAES